MEKPKNINPIEPNLKNAELNLEKLTFEQLKNTYQETQELARTTFCQTENGFRNALGEGIHIREREKIFKLYEISDSLRDVHAFLSANSANSILTRGSADKDQMMSAIKEMIEKLGNRIIE